MAEWFETWFDTPYYHQLYRNRNESEAKLLIDNLASSLPFQDHWNICDLACGKGRHSITLNSAGYNVTGLDLSKNNILEAKKSENERLKFFVHDLRYTFKPSHFNLVLNLFTSFGYFESNAENLSAVQSIAHSIVSGGYLIMDYMNSRAAVEHFNTNYIKQVDDLKFHISKRIEKGYIFKRIQFHDKGQDFDFEERVKLLFYEDFAEFFNESGLKLINIYGNYQLQKYEALSSPRLLMICQKL